MGFKACFVSSLVRGGLSKFTSESDTCWPLATSMAAEAFTHRVFQAAVGVEPVHKSVPLTDNLTEDGLEKKHC